MPWSVAPTPWGMGARALPTFSNGWAQGHLESKNSKQETDQTVLTTTKALTKTTNCTFRAKKWRGTTKRSFFNAGPVPPLSNSFRRHCDWFNATCLTCLTLNGVKVFMGGRMLAPRRRHVFFLFTFLTHRIVCLCTI